MIDNITCPYANHEDKKIVTICFHNDCNQQRSCCRQCVEQFHSGHEIKLIEVAQLNDFILNQPNQQKISPLTFCKSQNQIIQGLEQLSKIIDSFQKIVQERLQEIRGQNLQSYLLRFRTQQLGIDSLNELVKNLLKFVDVDSGRLTQKQKIQEDSLNQMEVKQLQNIKETEQSLLKLTESFIFRSNLKKLTFSKTPIQLVNHIDEAIISKDGLIIVTSFEKTIHIWGTRSNVILKIIYHDQNVYGIALSENNEYLAYTDYKYQIILYNLKKDQNLGKVKKYKVWVNYMIFSKDNQYLLSGGIDDKLRIWSFIKKKEICSIQNDSHIKMIVISPDNRLFSYICEKFGQIKIFDFQTQTKLIEQNYAHELGCCLCSTADSSIFISSGSEGIIKLWGLGELQNKKRSFTLIQQIWGARKIIHKVILTSDEEYLISTCNLEGKIMIHERHTGNLIQELESGDKSNSVVSISISNDMNILVSANQSNGIRIWTRE